MSYGRGVCSSTLSPCTPSDTVQHGADSGSSVALQGSVVSLDDELGCPGSPWESSFISFVLITFLLYNTWETNLQKRRFILLLFPEAQFVIT